MGHQAQDPRDKRGHVRTSRRQAQLAQRSAAKQVWVRIEEKTRLVEVGEETAEGLENKTREGLELGGGENRVYVVIEGGGLDWEGVVGMKEGKTIDIVCKMNGGGKQMKKVNRNPRNSSGET